MSDATQPSLQLFMQRLVDYAGLFPPAQLDLETAIHNFARYRREAESWMLGRFICPAARLSELDAFAHTALAGDPPSRFSVLLSGGDTIAEYLTRARVDIDAIEQFQKRHGRQVYIEVIEAKLPPTLVGDVEALEHLAEEMKRLTDRFVPSYVRVYFEAPRTESWAADFERLAAVLEMANDRLFPGSMTKLRGYGFKVRCGGVTAEDFPTVGQVARAISLCVDHNLPFKATAGLHHPIRLFNEEFQTPMHGFFNVFGAAHLAFACQLDEAEIEDVLEDEDASNFRFERDRFVWGTHSVSLKEIALNRESRISSFGSCSFDEPREDLTHLGLLPEIVREGKE